MNSPLEDVWVVVLGEQLLELGQLRVRERGPISALLASLILVYSGRVVLREVVVAAASSVVAARRAERVALLGAILLLLLHLAY